MRQRIVIAILGLLMLMPALSSADSPASHPRLLLTRADVAQLTGSALSPTFQRALDRVRARVDQGLDRLPDVPIPVDAGGGYTHEQHKRNHLRIHDAGILYQLTSDARYAEHVREILLEYARLYPELELHPAKKEQSPGRLFWQSLNEAVWLVHVIQGYDAIVETLSEDQRQVIESQLLRPMARFLSDEAPQTFDKIHNHGTWAVAAVGMTGYVLDDPLMVSKALLGLDQSGQSGFLRQLDRLFSPDGYYSEGPYYQRYALMPFLLFASAIETNEPGREIFAYRDGILLKAVDTAIQLSYANRFFGINDAIKDKGIDTAELTYGVAIAYRHTLDPGLLSIARYQDQVVLNGAGHQVAAALDAGLAQPFDYRSQLFRDGPQGRQGALAVIRSSHEPGHQAVVVKATAQGMNHGHFDKLHWMFFDNEQEIVSDYGAARFLNVVSKNGGHYLPENTSWAKQTIAHNTLVVDQRSHFDGQLEQASERHPDTVRFEVGDPISLYSARMHGAYEGVDFHRTMAMIRPAGDGLPVVLDLLRVESDQTHQYDLPLHYQGQITQISQPPEHQQATLSALGEANGYQHLWLRARADLDAGLQQVSWLHANRFYTWTAHVAQHDQWLFTTLGANDPSFNLIEQSAFIWRKQSAQNPRFVSVLEPHGEYNGRLEYTVASQSQVRVLDHHQADDADLIHLRLADDQAWVLAVAHDGDPERTHRITAFDTEYQWTGLYRLFPQPQHTSLAIETPATNTGAAQ